MLPVFETPNGQSEKDYLRELARDGWKKLLGDKVTGQEERQEYGDRFRKEFDVIEKANLFVSEIRVDGGSMLKRLRPAPQGRAHRIRKRSNHVTVVLGSNTIEA